MSESVRKRKGSKQDLNGSRPPLENNSQMVKPDGTLGKLKRWFLLLIIISAAFLTFKLIFGRFPLNPHFHATGIVDHVSASVGFQKKVYSIVFDAGSTGSRILVFTFHRVLADNSLKLDEELFAEVKPGLSSYADNPVKAAESLVPLLEKAKKQIPSSEWKHTPVVLKATAGLRLLPGAQAEAILHEVRKLFQSWPFLLSNDSVAIMDGADEGLYSWFTVNFLLDTLARSEEQILASLDLGGGSTQVTFVAAQKTIQAAAPTDLHSIIVFDKTIQLYTHSYLGLGLMAARLEILKTGNATHHSEDSLFINPCIHNQIETKWDYGGKTYTIKGIHIPKLPKVPNSVPSNDEGVERFLRCKKITDTIINAHVYAPPELHRQRVIAMSYYYDRATENGLIDPFIGGDVKVKNFFQIANHACSHPNADQPFSCMDLTYISSLLSKGLGLKPDKLLMLKKKIDNHEVSWALGAAFHILANDIIKDNAF